MEGLVIQALSLSAGDLALVEDVSLTVLPSQVMGIVGESGSGKSLTVMTAAGLRPPGIDWTRGRIDLAGKPIVDAVRSDIGVIFQDPFTSLNPVKKVGDILIKVLRGQHGLSQSDARSKAVAALGAVGIPDPAGKIDAYPHELSGGQRQRVVIALALLGSPKLIVADEPTSALDPSVQRQILDLILEVRGQAATLFVTHDMGAAAHVCDALTVMYAGRIVETGPVADVLLRPRHPYTQALIACTPKLDSGAPVTIAGQPLSAADRPGGCAFQERCQYATPACAVQPDLAGTVHKAACHHALVETL